MPKPPAQLSNVAPITALAFVCPPSLSARYLAVGEDCYVNIHHVPANRLSHRKRIFRRQRVYGIVVSDSGEHVLLWGGKSICVTRTADLLAEGGTVGEEVAAADWIFSAAFLKEDDVQIAAVTAHNNLLTYTQAAGWQAMIEGERCMLYAAQVLVLPDTGRILVAAGTVFGELLVWSIRDNMAVLHRTFQGHEGSIFGVCLSPAYNVGGVEWRFLASCSDDRTVRVWDVSQLDATQEKENRRQVTTGFGVKPAGEGCLALGWGHQARPWGVRFLPPRPGREFELVSFSEDTTVKFWEFPRLVQPNQTAELKTTGTHALHSGKNIWSFAFDFEQQTMATGGNDGRVRLLHYSGVCNKSEQWSIAEVKQLLGLKDPAPSPPNAAAIADPPTVKKKNKAQKKQVDAFKSYAIVSNNTVVATTLFGRVLSYDPQYHEWKYFGVWDRLKSSNGIDSWPGSSLAIVGARDGHIGIFETENHTHWWVKVALERGPISNIRTAVKSGAIVIISETYSFLVTSVSSPVCAYHSFRLPSPGVTELQRQESMQLELPDQKFALTSFFVDHASSKIYIGSREHGLAIYSLDFESFSPLMPVSFHSDLFVGDAITSISTPPSSSSSCPQLSTTCRNGTYTLHSLPSLTPLSVFRPPQLPAIEGHHHGPSVLSLHGFHGTRFISYSPATSTELFSAECGGAHRVWAFSPSSNTFVWTQRGSMHISRCDSSPHTILQPGLHGREIKAVAPSPDGTLIATGAEDTVIKISEVGEAGEWREMASFKRHTGGVMALCWSPDGNYLVSSGGRMELYVWRVRRLGQTVGVVEEAGAQVKESEAEMRILGVDVMEWDEGLLIATAESDSTVKVWHYNTTTPAFRLLLEGRYKECCLFHVKLLRLPSSRLLLFVSSTDGYLTAYSLPSLPRPSFKSTDVLTLPSPTWTQRIHQSSIKSLYFNKNLLEQDCLRIFTGGDDCAFGITDVSLSEERIETKQVAVLQRAHASAVTAVMALPAEGTETRGQRVLTAGMDQRVKIWRLERKKVRKENEVDSGVADIGDGCIISSGGADVRIIVAGVGVEVWSV